MLYIFAQATFLHASFRDPCCSPVSHRAHSCPARPCTFLPCPAVHIPEQRAAITASSESEQSGRGAYAKKRLQKAAKKRMAQVEQERLDAEDAFLLEAAENEAEKEAAAIVDLYLHNTRKL